MTRRYLLNSFDLLAPDMTRIIGTPYEKGPGLIDAEGSFGNRPFGNLAELVAVAGWNKAESDAFVARLDRLLKHGTLTPA